MGTPNSQHNVTIGVCANVGGLGCDNVHIGYDVDRCDGKASLGTSQKNVIIGNTANACTYSCSSQCVVMIGHGGYVGLCNGCNRILIGHYVCGDSSDNRAYYGGCCVNNIYLCGCIIKTSGSFAIPHPSEGKHGKWLQHSFVETPTAGDNLYRWAINTDNCKHSIELPDYYKYLNHNSTVKISSVGHFGKAYGKVSEDGNYLNICSNQDGKYNVLAIATRCDDFITKGINGRTFRVEEDMNERDLEEFGVK
jgi:hypothetical protein